MKTFLIHVAVVLAVLITQAEARAQRPAGVAAVKPLFNVQPISTVRPYYYHAPNWNYYRYRSATVGESYARGFAAMTYARGQYNRLTAEARVLHADAYRSEIANHELAAGTYFAMRQANREARAAERRPRATAADLARFAAQAKPNRLSPSELSNTGQIAWPILLQANEFAAFRVEMEDAFAQRAANGGTGLDDHVKVGQTTKVMLDVLKAHVGGVQPMDYMAARRFIESLAHEARQPLS